MTMHFANSEEKVTQLCSQLSEVKQMDPLMFNLTCLFLVQGGNDYEIYSDQRTIGHAVSCPEETRQLCQQLFFSVVE